MKIHKTQSASPWALCQLVTSTWCCQNLEKKNDLTPVDSSREIICEVSHLSLFWKPQFKTCLIRCKSLTVQGIRGGAISSCKLMFHPEGLYKLNQTNFLKPCHYPIFLLKLCFSSFACLQNRFVYVLWWGRLTKMFSVCLLVNVSNFEVSGIPGIPEPLDKRPQRPQRKPAFEKLPGMTHLDISHHQPKHDRRHVGHIQSMISGYQPTSPFLQCTSEACWHCLAKKKICLA